VRNSVSRKPNSNSASRERNNPDSSSHRRNKEDEKNLDSSHKRNLDNSHKRNLDSHIKNKNDDAIPNHSSTSKTAMSTMSGHKSFGDLGVRVAVRSGGRRQVRQRQKETNMKMMAASCSDPRQFALDFEPDDNEDSGVEWVDDDGDDDDDDNDNDNDDPKEDGSTPKKKKKGMLATLKKINFIKMGKKKDKKDTEVSKTTSEDSAESADDGADSEVERTGDMDPLVQDGVNTTSEPSTPQEVARPRRRPTRRSVEVPTLSKEEDKAEEEAFSSFAAGRVQRTGRSSVAADGGAVSPDARRKPATAARARNRRTENKRTNSQNAIIEAATRARLRARKKGISLHTTEEEEGTATVDDNDEVTQMQKRRHDQAMKNAVMLARQKSEARFAQHEQEPEDEQKKTLRRNHDNVMMEAVKLAKQKSQAFGLGKVEEEDDDDDEVKHTQRRRRDGVMKDAVKVARQKSQDQDTRDKPANDDGASGDDTDGPVRKQRGKGERKPRVRKPENKRVTRACTPHVSTSTLDPSANVGDLEWNPAAPPVLPAALKRQLTGEEPVKPLRRGRKTRDDKSPRPKRRSPSRRLPSEADDIDSGAEQG